MKLRNLFSFICLTALVSGLSAQNWAFYNPLANASATTPEGGPYNISSPASPNPADGPARAALVDSDSNTTGFFYAIDILDFDSSLTQAFGIIARGDNFSIGQLDGYTLNLNFQGHLVMNRIVNEVPEQFGWAAYGELDPTHHYRLVFSGVGFDFVGELYDLNTDPINPVATLNRTDELGLYSSGKMALFALAEGDNDQGINVTFGHSPIPEPATYATAFGVIMLLSTLYFRRRN